MKEDRKLTITPTLTFRNFYKDGRCAVVLAEPNGDWKVEVFATVDHAHDFAIENGYKVTGTRRRHARD